MRLEKTLSEILLIGSGGFIGTAISTHLMKNGDTIVNVDRSILSKLKDGSLKLKNLVTNLDTIIFCAAKVPSKSPQDYFENIELVNDVVNLIEDIPFKYILNISSDAVYSDYDRAISESDPPNPTTLHGMMHFSRELILKSIFKRKLGNMRPTLVYGPGDRHNSYGPNRFIREGLNGNEIHIIGEGEELRDHIFIDDVAKITVEMIKSRMLGDLNAATGVCTSFKAIAQFVKQAIPSSKITYLERKVKKLPHNGYRAFDISKLGSLNKHLKLTEIQDGIQMTVMNYS